MIPLIMTVIVFSLVMYKVITAPQAQQVPMKYDDNPNSNLEHDRRMRDVHYYQERAWVDSVKKDI